MLFAKNGDNDQVFPRDTGNLKKTSLFATTKKKEKETHLA